MLLSKDIMRWMIENYFDKETVYTFQFVSKWTKSCITSDNLYLAQCAKVAKDMQNIQVKYLNKRRQKDIYYVVNLEIANLEDKKLHLYLKKKLLIKYEKQEGDTRCWKCYKISTPNDIKEHIKTCPWSKFTKPIKCKMCDTSNYEEYDSPHRSDRCPLEIISCCYCDFKGPRKLIYHHRQFC